MGEKVLKIIPTESGSGATSFVQTQKGCYMAKVGERHWINYRIPNHYRFHSAKLHPRYMDFVNFYTGMHYGMRSQQPLFTLGLRYIRRKWIK